MTRVVTRKSLALYKRILIGYSLLVVFTLSIVFALMHTLFDNRQQQNVRNTAIQIEDSMQRFDAQLGNSLQVVRRFISSSADAYSLIYGEAEDYAKQHMLHRALAPLISYNDTLHSISLFNAEQQKLIFKPLPSPLKDPLEDVLLQGNYLDTAFVPYEFMGRTYLSCLFMLDTSLQNRQNAVLSINLDCAQLTKRIAPILKEQSVLLLSNDDHLLLSAGTILLPELLDESCSLPAVTGYDIHRLVGEDWLVVQHCSAFLPWRIVSLYPMHSFSEALSDLNLYWAAPVFLVLFFFVCWLLFNRSFRKPLIQIFNTVGAPKSVVSNLELEYLQQSYANRKVHMQKLENDVSRLISALSESYYSILLSGEAKKLEHIASFVNPFEGPYYMVLLAATHHQEDCGIQRVDQLLCEMVQVDRLTITDDTIVYLKQLASPDDLPEAFLLGCEEARREFKKEFGYPFALALGTIVASLEQLDQSYQMAQKAMKYTVLYGRDVILQETVFNTQQTDGFSYPKEIEQAILQAFDRLDSVSMRRQMDKFIQSMYTQDVDSIELYYHQLFYSVTAHMSPLPNGRILPAVLAETPVKAALDELYNQMAAVLEYKRKNNLDDLAKRLLLYTQEHLDDPTFSLSALADAFELSTGYVSRLYKDGCGVSFSESLMQLRMEKSIHLLQESDMPLAQIAQECGYNTTSYFHSCFKKVYCVTPGQYRKQHSGEQA